MEFLPTVTKIVNVPDNLNKIFYTKLNFYNEKDTYKEFLDMVLNRLTFVSAIYLCIICIVPTLVVGANTRLGGTSMLILVSVCVRVMMNIQTFLQSERYESAYKVRGKFKGARKRF